MKPNTRALQQVNHQQMQLYWDLGQLITKRQQPHGWGKGVVETLARDLQTEFVGMSGFSVSNLWRMRSFFLEYKKDEFLAQAVREIPQSLAGEIACVRFCNQWLHFLHPPSCRPFFPSNKELVRRLVAVTAALRGPSATAPY